MSSVVYYRFRSSKNSQRLTFDGTGISVFDVKRGILLVQKLDTTADTFQLILSNPDTQEEYTDDSEILPRSTLVEARRLPLARAGGFGAASHYVSGSLAINAKNASRRENFRNIGGTAGADNTELLSSAAGGGSEQDMMNVMFAQQGAQWSQTQQEMATKTKVYTPKPTASSEPDKTLPPGYICHRCGQKGHWITQCPSLYDRNWETKKVLRTTGIPKSMLRTVSSGAIDGDNENNDGRSYLMNAEGEYVVAVADDKSWEAFQARQLQQQARAKRLVPEELKDPISHKLMRDPRKMPCCGRTYSDETIETSLIQTDFRCPNCGKDDVYIDQLQLDKEMQEKVRNYLAEQGDAEAAKAAASTTTITKDDDDAVQSDTNNNAMEDDESEDSEYSPLGPRKRRRSSASSVDSDMSVISLKRTEEEPSQPASNDTPAPQINPMMMPFMFNPFLMAMMNQQSNQTNEEDSDYEIGDERPVVGRIR